MRTPLDIAFRIWMIAISVFALLFSLAESDWSLVGFWVFLMTFLMVLCLTAVFTFPVFAVLIVLLKRCQSSGLQGAWALCIVYAVGITCAIIVYYFVAWLFTFIGPWNNMLFGIAIVSGVAGITMNAHSILKISTVEPEKV